jgi:hypothetical protein
VIHGNAQTSSWPAEICATLVECRNGNMPFPAAWKVALRVNPKPANEEWTGWDSAGRPRPIEEPTLSFMRRHFEAAYERSPGRLGRLRAEPPEECAEGLSTAPVASHDGSDATVPMPWCRSSAVCSKRAVNATPGARFCQEHTEEMARVAAMPDPPLSFVNREAA